MVQCEAFMDQGEVPGYSEAGAGGLIFNYTVVGYRLG